jgi:alpha-L-arabinofuranosidase
MSPRHPTRRAWRRGLAVGLAALALAACQASPTAPSADALASASPPPLPTLTPTVAVSHPGLFVDAGQPAGPVSPWVYGTNYGPWLFVPLQMQPAAEAANLSVLRYPGGNWGDRNDMDEWNLDQYIQLARQFGAEPYVHVRLLNGTPEKAAEIVRLLNVQKQYGVRFWSIGNEPNLFGDGYDTDQYVREWRQWAEAMKAVDPSIVLIGPEINQFYANPSQAHQLELERWMVAFLEANGDLVDVVSFHRYPFPSSQLAGPPSADELRHASAEWDALIPYARALVRQHTGRDLPIAVTEVNSSWAASSGGETTMDSHLNAIWWGDALGRMIRNGVYMVNQFAIIGEFGLMNNYDVNPIYNVYLMYKEFGQQRLQASSDQALVSVFASLREDGRLALIVVNLSAEAQQVPLTIAGWQLPAQAEVLLFDKDHAAVPQPALNLNPQSELQLSPESMLLLLVPAP